MPAMTNKMVLAVVCLAAASGSAHAGGQAGSIGVGAEVQISGLGGASVNYDAGDFHVGGFLGFHDAAGPDNDILIVGARFFYHVHSTAMADFSLGGTIGIASDNNPAPVDRQTHVLIEPSVQIRLFLAANVALSVNTGIVIGVVDAEQVSVTGQLVGGTAFGFAGGAGLHYYFF
jgi:hypothetical protein